MSIRASLTRKQAGDISGKAGVTAPTQWKQVTQRLMSAPGR